LQIRIQPLAEQDVRETYAWYNSRRENLGSEFLESLEVCLDRIAQNPKSYQVVHKHVRRALLRRFPFCVYYVIADAEAVVIAVLHGRRDATQWRSRT
jgi:plasmid stabilization system protein ParE